MIDDRARPLSRDRFGGLLLIVLLTAAIAGCAAHPAKPSADAVEVVLPTGEALARSAVITVLTGAGYTIETKRGERLETGYRKEIRGPWDRLLVYRFGTVRSWVAVTLSPELDATRIRIDVYCEGKDSLFGFWRPYETPMPLRAETHLREIRKTLDVL